MPWWHLPNSVTQLTRASVRVSPNTSASKSRPTSGISGDVWKSKWICRNRLETRAAAVMGAGGVGEVFGTVVSPLREWLPARLNARARYSFAPGDRLLYNGRMGAGRLRTKEDTLRARDRIRARAAERHKARNRALPVGQRPVKWLWPATAIFSINFLCALDSNWRHRAALIGALHHFPAVGSPPFHALMWDQVSVFNTFASPALLVSYWSRTLRARAERRRVREQRRAARVLRGEGVWPPAPRA